MADLDSQLVEQVKDAAARGGALRVVGRNSKAFYGREPAGELLSVAEHRGIISYQPEELVLTARAGTSLAEIEAALDEQGQRLAFEPPHFGEGSIGGTLACNQSGPARPWAGSVRDMVLGLRLVNGRGEHLRFGGQVMKNVAGYDVSRLQAGAMGCLGIITEISLKVLPKPAASRTLVLAEEHASGAIEMMNRMSARPLPLNGACWMKESGTGRLYLRFEGAANAVQSAVEALRRDRSTTEEPASADDFWRDLREHKLEFFAGDETLWRVSSGPTRVLPRELDQDRLLIDWGGAQRWLRGDTYTLEHLNSALEGGGEVCAFRNGDRQGEVFPPMSAPLQTLHRRLKDAFDPRRLFNPGRLYSWL